MSDTTIRCIQSAERLFEETLPAFPPRQSRDPVGWPAVLIELTEPIHARVAVRNAVRGDIIGIADVPAESIPRDLIFAVRSWLEETLGQMPEAAAKELVDSEPAVIINTASGVVAIANGDALKELASPSSPTLH